MPYQSILWFCNQIIFFREINKTALGATDTVTWEYKKDVLEVIQDLKSQNVAVFAIEQVEGAIFLDEFKAENIAKQTKEEYQRVMKL